MPLDSQTNSISIMDITEPTKVQYVTKRNGGHQEVLIEKIIRRLIKTSWELDMEWINPSDIAHDVVRSVSDNITTEKLDYLMADICAAKINKHPHFNKLAARLSVSSLHKITNKDYFEVIKTLYSNKDNFGDHAPLVSPELYNIVDKNREIIQREIVYSISFSHHSSLI